MTHVGASRGHLPAPPPMRVAALPAASTAGPRFGDEPTVRIRRDGTADLDLVLVMDDSGSTTWTDPDDHRYVAARRLVTALARAGGWSHYLRARHRRRLTRLDRAWIDRTAWASDRVACISFTEEVTRVLPPVLLPEAIDDVRAFLAGPGPRGGTALTPALRAAAGCLGHAAPRGARPRRTVVAVFTDGELADEPGELAAAVRALPPRSAHLITLGDTPGPEPTILPVDDLTTSSIADLADPRGLEHLLARAVEDRLASQTDPG